MNPLADLPQIFNWGFSRTTGMFSAGHDNSNVYFYREILVSGKAGFINYSLKNEYNIYSHTNILKNRNIKIKERTKVLFSYQVRVENMF